MASHESEEPTVARTGMDPATEVQDDAAAAASVELSMPANVHQHEDAPEAAGYVLTRPLGAGAYGQVWHAWQLRTRKEVAIKIFMQRSGLDWIFLQREVERLSRLDRHPHIVTLLDIGLDEEPPFYSMDLITGGTLGQYVDPEARVDRTRGVAWMSQICDALSYVHSKGLIHCDLKPANILVDGRDQVRVVDFGQSRVFTESAASIGTLFFMAPEQANLWEPGAPVQPDVRWDVYALGASMYAILTGRVAYATQANQNALEQAPTLADRLTCYRKMIAEGHPPEWSANERASSGEELVAMVDKCMALQPEDRYASISEIEQDLAALRNKRPVTPLAGSVGYRSRKFLQRNPFKVVLALAMVALGAALVVGAVRQARLDRANAVRLMAAFVHDPVSAVAQMAQARSGVRRQAGELTEQYADSSAYTDRVMAARAAFFVNRAAFWESVVDGQLWSHGEWLELIAAFRALGVETPLAQDQLTLLDELEAKLAGGSLHEKYVALCLLGELRPDRTGLGDRCAAAAARETQPGVVLAAAWAARQMGTDVSLVSGDRVLVDDLTGMVFAAIPSTADFRRGSAADDPDRFPDEDQLDEGVDIRSVFVASTEVTQSAFAEFLASVIDGSTKVDMEDGELAKITGQYKGADPNEAHRIAIGGMTLNTARQFCAWLNIRSAGATPARTYRLPSEDEWEYAARGGSDSGRYCFGDDASYARYFAHCDGTMALNHFVADRMPNYFGLSDMHGGLWEATASAYPPEHAAPRDKERVIFALRGGAWYSPAVRCRSAQRNYHTANQYDIRNGIRLVLELAK